MGEGAEPFGLCVAHGTPDVVGHRQHAAKEEQPAAMRTMNPGSLAGSASTKVGAVLVHRSSHQALVDAVDPHRGDVEQGGQPEMQIVRPCYAWRRGRRPAGPGDSARRSDHRRRAERAGVLVADGPLGVEGVDGLDRHHRNRQTIL